MFGFEAILPAIIIAVVFVLCAVFALIGLVFAAVLWRKRRRKLSVFIGLPSLIILTGCVWLFTPRPLPEKKVTIDLSHPNDLSGIPKDTHWFSRPSDFCSVEGRVHIKITLESGHVIEDTVRRIFIYRDKDGIVKIDLTSFALPPAGVDSKNQVLLKQLLADSSNSFIATRLSNDLQERLSSYTSGSELGYYVPYVIGPWEIVYGVTATFRFIREVHAYRRERG